MLFFTSTVLDLLVRVALDVIYTWVTFGSHEHVGVHKDTPLLQNGGVQELMSIGWA